MRRLIKKKAKKKYKKRKAAEEEGDRKRTQKGRGKGTRNEIRATSEWENGKMGKASAVALGGI